MIRADGDTRRIGPLSLARAGDGDLPAGRFAVLTGRYRDGRLVADRANIGHPVLPPTLDRLSVEAYAGEVHGRPALHGFGHAVARGTRLERLVDRRAVFIGPLANAFLIEHGIPLPDGLSAQRDALRAVGDGLQPRSGVIETR